MNFCILYCSLQFAVLAGGTRTLTGTDYLVSPETNEVTYRTASRTDTLFSGGFWLSVKSPPPRKPRSFFAEIEAGLFLDEGRDAPRTQSVRYSGEPEDVPERNMIFTGPNAFLGFTLCDDPERSCSLRLGRVSPPSEAHDFLTGAHGGLTGAFFEFKNGRYGELKVSPFYFPDQGTSAADLPGLLVSGRKAEPRTDFASYGQRASYLAAFGGLQFSLHYATHRSQEASLRFPDGSLRTDRIDYAGFGLLYAPIVRFPYWEMFFALERSAGSYGALHSTGRSKVEGTLLLGGGRLHFPRTTFDLRLYLPEPGTPAEGAFFGSEERSGYVGYGGLPYSAPVLSDTLGARPHPVPCPDRNECDGLQNSGDIRRFSRHAAFLQFGASHRREAFELSLSCILFRPLAPKREEGPNSLLRLKTDDKSEGFDEIHARLSFETAGKSKLTLEYARLYDRRGGDVSLFGESVRIFLSHRL